MKNSPPPRRPPRPFIDRTPEQAEMFCNRVVRNYRHRIKQAEREGLEAFRIYERDIPEIRLAVDWYKGHLHVSDFSSRMQDDGGLWAHALADAAAEGLGVPPSHVHVKQRRPRVGPQQYQRVGDGGGDLPVREGELRFLVNLDDYIDTGLFLDHRVTRRLVAAEARGKHVLNLFSYTGSFSVYAARAGAASTTSVDLSQRYLEWTHRNFELNGLVGPRHGTIRADVRRFLDRALGDNDRWDLVVVDPPTFSNSAASAEAWDVCRDHPALLRQVLDVVLPGGVVWFSTNAQRFEPDFRSFEGRLSSCEELTERTLPFDFRQMAHRVWRMELARGRPQTRRTRT